MELATAFDREKLELEALLASGIFSRAPNLSRLLIYVCTKYFEGAAEEIKEYNIAIDALGRPPEFDQKRDSIVRVEAHRLRKRLREYYEGDGSSHEIRIEIPSGQYTPLFVAKTPAALEKAHESSVPTVAVAEEVQDLAVITAPVPISVPARVEKSGRSWLTITSLLVFVAGTAFVFFSLRAKEHTAPPVAERVLTPSSGDDVRILCGVENGSYIDAFERGWQSDRFFTGGYVSQMPRPRAIIGSRDQRLYQNSRNGQFGYDIPLRPGPYLLKLYFAETLYGDNNAAGGGETSRLFNVSANGKPLLQNFDVIGDAGTATADIKVFKDIEPGPDGKLHLLFSPTTNAAFINAIEILPGLRGRIRPIRIVARDRGLTDGQGRYWDPDRYAKGGQLIARPDSNVVSADAELYRSERFGNLTYTIPVAEKGRYGVNLYFAENWFGPGMPGGGSGPGSRLFDILINGVAVRRNFDIFKEAAGTTHAAVVNLHGVEPNHQGKVVISLIPAQNYACINALEVFDESK